jgi:hypothetical protein
MKYIYNLLRLEFVFKDRYISKKIFHEKPSLNQAKVLCKAMLLDKDFDCEKYGLSMDKLRAYGYILEDSKKLN